MRHFSFSGAARAAVTVSLSLAFVVCGLGDFRPVPSKTAAAAQAVRTVQNVEEEGVVRPDELDEGLTRKTLDEIADRRVTVREPVMEILNDNISRTPAESLGDTFTLVDFSTDEPYEDAELAKVTFTGTDGDLSDPKYPMLGLNDYRNGNNRYFSDFEKYMLLRQAVYYNQRAMRDAAAGTLKKHPAADYIYGSIPETAKAVRKRIVTDPVYRSPMTTGLYLAPGERASVHVTGLKEGESITLYTHHQDSLAYIDGGPNGNWTHEQYYTNMDNLILEEARAAKAEQREPAFESLPIRLNGQWSRQNQKVPRMGAEFVLDHNGDFWIGCIYGGPLYFKPTDSAVELTIEGAVETPHFILGVTTPSEFERLREAPGLIATLDCENGQLIGYSKYMRECDDIEKLAYFWHSVFAVDSSFNGRAYNYNVTLSYDMHVPAGEAVALNANFAAQPAGWFQSCMKYGVMTTVGNWGTLHELGHIHAKTYNMNWGMRTGGEGEVWNNVLIVLIYTMLCNMDTRFVTVEHGEFTHPYLTVNKSLNLTKNQSNGEPITDYSHFDNTGGAGYFDQISLYANLIHAFGPEKFVEFFYTHGQNQKYSDNTRADFCYRIALVDKVNLFKWLNSSYHANLTEGDFTPAQWEYLCSLPDFYPVAYRWGNGIDGNETARKYEVDGKFGTEFDFSGENILCPVPFRILSVSQPLHGSLDVAEDLSKAVYTPPVTATESDEFTVTVRVEGGRTVDLNVRFNLLYRGVYTEVWDLTDAGLPAKPNVEQALAYAQSNARNFTEGSRVAVKDSFTKNGVAEYYHSRFKFIATEAGVHTFYIKADDASRVIFRENDENGAEIKTLQTSQDRPQYTQNGSVEKELAVGETVYVEAHLVNWGGLGYLKVGVRFPGQEEIVDIPQKNIVSAGASAEDLAAADAFPGWQPKFFTSIKNTNIDYVDGKEDWEVIKTPIAASNEPNGQDPQNLVDGKNGTFFHSSYSGARTPFPHEYIVDLKKDTVFNYFDLVRRGNSNDKIYHYGLFGALDGAEPLGEEGYFGIGDYFTENPGALTYSAAFESVTARYLKIVIYYVNGQSNFTVPAEFYAGLRVGLGQTVKPSSFQKESTGFEENAANGKLTAQGTGAEFVFEFFGTGFDLFADTAPGLGTASVSVDDMPKGEIDLNAPLGFNRCVYRLSGLNVGRHTVRVTTMSEATFNISFINVDYAVPVEEEDYPAEGDDYGDEELSREFPAGWKTRVKDFGSLRSISFLHEAPADYEDTFVRLDTYIRVFRKTGEDSRLAFVYPGEIRAPKECGSLFAGCSALTSVDFTNFDTSAMAGAVSMFGGCASLLDLDLSGFSTENSLYMGGMFNGCVSLGRVDLSGFTFAEGTNLSRFFEGCTALSEIRAPRSIAEDIAVGLNGKYFDAESGRYSEELSAVNEGHTVTLHAAHEFEDVAEVPAGCLTEGTLAHKRCPCGELRIGEEPVTEEQLVISPKGHTEVTVEGKAPTCTESGLTEGKKCSVCGEVLEEQTELPAKGHTEVTVEGKVPTCTESGLTEGKKCSVCGEVLEEQTELPAKGHDWGEWRTVKEPTDSEEGLRERTCSAGHTEREAIPMLQKTVKTEDRTGLIVGLTVGPVSAAGIGVAVYFIIRAKKKRV